MFPFETVREVKREKEKKVKERNTRLERTGLLVRERDSYWGIAPF